VKEGIKIQLQKKLLNYPYLTLQSPIKTRVKNGVRVVEINGKFLDKIIIDEALEKLNQKERDAIYLVYIFGVEPEEAAIFLRTSRWAVYKRLERGLKRLEKILDIVENKCSNAKC